MNKLRRIGLLAFVCLLMGNRFVFAADPLAHQVSLPAGMTWCDDSLITGLLTQVNAYRAEKGQPALRMDALGMKVAETRAIQFANYMTTNPPGSPGFNPHQGWDTTAASLGYNIVSENLAYMTSNPGYIVYAAWQDPLHIAAMLASDANVAGVSCVIFNGTPYWSYEPGKSGATQPPPTGGGAQPPPSTGGGTQPPSTGGGTTDETAAFLTLINQYRAENGLNPLQISPMLTAAANWMANDMATKNYASHTDSLNRSVGARLAAFGYTYMPYGENIAGGFGDAATALNQWKTACDPDASGACTYAHRKAMLSAGFAAIGIARAYNANSSYGWYWVTDFGGYVDSGSQPSPPPAPAPGSAPVISSFTASPASITSGQSATLAWSVSGATSLSIDNGIGAVSGTSKAITPAKTTTYVLTASNSSGTKTASATITVAAPAADTQPPTVPGLTSAIAKSETRVDLAWRASTDNIAIAGYQILRNGSPAGSVGGTVLAFTDSVAPNTTYSYTVRAFDGAGNYSAPSNAVQVTTPVAQTGACPGPAQGAFTGCYYNNADLSGAPALVRTDAAIDFDWLYTRPAPAITGTTYSASWQGNFQFSAGLYMFSVVASDGVRLYIDGNLVLDRWRDQALAVYTVRSTLSAGTHLIRLEYYQRTGSPRAYLTWLTNTPAASAPAISSFTANPAAIAPGQSATLAWTVSGATSVTIDNGIGDVSGATTSRQVSPAQTTTYRLTASNSTGSVTAAATVSVGSGADGQPPTAPALTSASAASATRVDLAWGASADNVGVTNYRVFRNGVVVATVPGSALSYADSTASAGTTYLYTVRALDAAGNLSAASNGITVTTPSAPAASTCTPATNAFTGCYYGNADLAGTPALIRTDNQINFDWMYGAPDRSLPLSNYSVRWQGNFTFEQGTYTFNATTSDGMRIYIDGTLILDRWRDQPVYSYAIRRDLTAGTHLVTVEYYERTGSATARLAWQKN